MVIRDAARAVFVGKYFGEWFCAGFRWDGIGWTFDGYAGGGERLAIHIWDDLMTSSWYIDPSYDRPSPDDTEIHVLVTESSCSSSSYASGRIGAPLVESREQTLTITFGVRPLRGSHNCMGNPATPAILRLREPVGDRQLLDGSSHPAHEPVCGVMDDCGLMKSD